MAPRIQECRPPPGVSPCLPSLSSAAAASQAWTEINKPRPRHTEGCLEDKHCSRDRFDTNFWSQPSHFKDKLQLQRIAQFRAGQAAVKLTVEKKIGTFLSTDKGGGGRSGQSLKKLLSRLYLVYPSEFDASESAMILSSCLLQALCMARHVTWRHAASGIAGFARFFSKPAPWRVARIQISNIHMPSGATRA